MSAGESARATANKLRADAERLRSEADHWDRAAGGEERVGALLERADRTTTRVLHDRLLTPGDAAGNLDHVVVCPGGVFLIDAKNWPGDVTVHDNALWQHADGPRSLSREVQVVRALAAKMAKITRRAVTPVICLVGEQADRFGEPALVQDVHVVGIDRLLTWLAERPAVMRPEDVATRAVDLSMQFPPAVDSGLTLHDLVEPRLKIEPRRHRSRRAHRAYPTPAGGEAAPRTGTGFPVRLVVALVVGLALFAAGSRLVTTFSQGTADAVTQSTAAATTLSPTRLQELADWRVRAQLYRDNVRPPALRTAPDSALGRYAGECRDQVPLLAPLRRGLLDAPDPQLAAAARSFDRAAREYLAACGANRVGDLHEAEGAMKVAAAEVNLRYNRLQGKDPTATGVL